MFTTTSLHPHLHFIQPSLQPPLTCSRLIGDWHLGTIEKSFLAQFEGWGWGLNNGVTLGLISLLQNKTNKQISTHARARASHHHPPPYPQTKKNNVVWKLPPKKKLNACHGTRSREPDCSVCCCRRRPPTRNDPETGITVSRPIRNTPSSLFF